MLYKKLTSVLLIVALVFAFAGCQKKTVTAKDLVDAYLEASAEVDYSSDVKVKAEMLYHGEWEGIKDLVHTEYRESYDADTKTTYQKGSSTMTYVYPNGKEEPTVQSLECYIVSLEDGSQKTYMMNPETGKWVTTVGSSESLEPNVEVLYSAAEMREEESYYVLTVVCDAEEVGFDVAEFLLGEGAELEIRCRATLTAHVDKDTMKCTFTSLAMDAADLNEVLSENEMGYEMLTLQIDIEDLNFAAVELKAPEA